MRMRKISWLIVFLLSSLHLSAQLSAQDKKYLDSLNQLAVKTKSDSVRAELYFTLSDYWVDRDSVKTIGYLNKGIKYGQPYAYLRGRYYYLLADYYAAKDPAKSEVNYLKADKELAAFTTKRAYKQRAMLWHNYALLHQHEDDLKATLEILINKVLPLAQKGGDDVMLGTEYISISTIFMNLEQYDKAVMYSEDGIKYFQHTPPGQFYLLVNAYLTTAESYYHLDNIRQTKKYLDLAKGVLNKSEKVVSHSNMEIFWLKYYEVLGWHLIEIKQYDAALESIEKGTVLAKRTENNYSLQALAFNRYDILFAQHKYAEAERLLLHLAKQKEIHALADNRLKTAQKLAAFYQATGNMKEAYNWLKRSNTLSDSINESKLKTDINTLEIKYHAAENEKKIAGLSAEKKQNLLTLKNQRLTNWLLIAAIILLLVLAGFIFFYYRSYKKLAIQREINLQQQATEQAQKQEIEVTRAMLDAEENERNRVARDLHDGLGGMLAGVKINLLSWAKYNKNMETQDFELQRIIGQLDGSVNELRNIARNMMPQTLLNYGLEAALKELCESVMDRDMEVDFQPINITKDIGLSQQISIYRIVQEILANILKHAGATEILLQCSENQHRFYITVEDNGKGFDVEISNLKNGLGLANIRKRVEYFNGRFDIASTINEGTTINIELDV